MTLVVAESGMLNAGLIRVDFDVKEVQSRMENATLRKLPSLWKTDVPQVCWSWH